MHLRPTSPEDLPAVTRVQRAYDAGWFGEPENDQDEVQEWLDLAESACVVEDSNRVVGAGNRWRTGSSVIVDPGTDVPAAVELLVAWLGDVAAPNTEVLDRDEVLGAALERAGWRYAYSTFDLLRPVSAEWMLPEPAWPGGVTLRPYRPDEAELLHRLIYVDAGWAEIPGHHARDFAEWHQIFLHGRRAEELPIIAWRDAQPVGAALLRLFSDGTGWIAQLAVARSERGHGLGRALLLDGLRRVRAAGATKLGLSVVASNRGALQLYLDVGLPVEREWQTLLPPAR